jgi:hypothetical protein
MQGIPKMDPSPVMLRPFGRAQDLELEFTHGNRPALVTALLNRCSDAADSDYWWDQTVGMRIAGLLRVLLLTEGHERAVGATLRCAEPQCGETFEIELPVGILLPNEPAGDAAPAAIAISLNAGRSAVLRRPTGRDLGNWRDLHHATRREAIAAMIGALLIDGSIDPDDEPIVAEVMATHDPLVAFTVDCTCPACGTGGERHVDLEEIVLARLNARQRELLREVHVLASRYGWPERDILGIAPQRRARYLKMIEEGP